MPFYTGFDILRQLKKHGVRHKCIIILTGSNLKIDDIADYIDVGVREILKKPIGLDQFDRIVKSYDGWQVVDSSRTQITYLGGYSISLLT